MALSCPLWFITGLFCANICYWFISKLKKNRNVMVVCICTLVSYGMDYFSFPKLPWNMDTALMAVLFLMIGNYLHESTNYVEKLKKSKAVTVLISMIFLCIGYIGMYFNDIEEVGFSKNRYGNYFLMLLGSIPVILSFYCICRILPLESLAANFISCVGRHTLFILGFDYTAGRIARLLLPEAVENWLMVFGGKCILLLAGFGVWRFLIKHLPNDKIRAHLSRY